MARTVIQITVAFEDVTLEEAAEAATQMEQQALAALHSTIASSGHDLDEFAEVMTWYGATVLVPRNLEDGTVAA